MLKIVDLRIFDIDDLLYENSYKKAHLNEIKEKIKPYTIYLSNEEFGLCLKEQKDNIVKVLKEYGTLSLQRNFVKPTTLFSLERDFIDWDDIYIGKIALDGNLVWNEFGKLLEMSEEDLINKKNDVDEIWYSLQRVALRKCLDKEINRLKKELKDLIRDVDSDYLNYTGIYKRKDI